MYIARAWSWFRHYWLPQQVTPVWQVICLAAVTAMNDGRKHLWQALRSRQRGGDALGQVADLVPKAASHAAGRFWLELLDFAAQSTAPTGWERIGEDHPFFAISGPVGEQRLSVAVSLAAAELVQRVQAPE
mmetsp:Transcript_5001/g.8711  ORF Transcript_5001/g.8711 Transcript_5001/m.8711 type:complete len:131 (-) Transcript_5001:95-487(-)